MTHEIPNKIYREHLIELYKSPNNYGTLKDPSAKATEQNMNCGDEITIELLVKDGIVKDAKFNGSGCVMAVVSASMLTEKLQGMKVSYAKALDRNDIFDMLKVKLSPARIKCALLPLEALRKALK